eukprot:942313-Lingulodinium_polyedra.AAC.1
MRSSRELGRVSSVAVVVTAAIAEHSKSSPLRVLAARHCRQTTVEHKGRARALPHRRSLPSHNNGARCWLRATRACT